MSDNVTKNDPLLHLEQLVPLCDSIRQGTEYRAALAQATREVQKAADLPSRLESLESVLGALRATPQLQHRELIFDLDKLEAAGRCLERCVSADALKDARFSVKDAQDAFQRIEALVSKAWAAQLQAEFSPLQRLGLVLAGIPDTKTAGTELQTWAMKVLTEAGSGPPTAEAVMHFAQGQAEIADRLVALGNLGIDATVSTFLLHVAAGHATLADVTPQVLEWLRAKNAQSRFQVKLA